MPSIDAYIRSAGKKFSFIYKSSFYLRIPYKELLEFIYVLSSLHIRLGHPSSPIT